MIKNDLFLNAVIEKKLVFKEKDYINFYNICNKKIDIETLKEYKNNMPKYGYKVSKSFFGSEYFHPEHINPYRVNYDLSNIMKELKLDNQKMKENEKLDKLINYFDYLS